MDSAIPRRSRRRASKRACSSGESGAAVAPVASSTLARAVAGTNCLCGLGPKERDLAFAPQNRPGASGEMDRRILARRSGQHVHVHELADGVGDLVFRVVLEQAEGGEQMMLALDDLGDARAAQHVGNVRRAEGFFARPGAAKPGYTGEDLSGGSGGIGNGLEFAEADIAGVTRSVGRMRLIWPIGRMSRRCHIHSRRHILLPEILAQRPMSAARASRQPLHLPDQLFLGLEHLLRHHDRGSRRRSDPRANPISPRPRPSTAARTRREAHRARHARSPAGMPPRTLGWRRGSRSEHHRDRSPCRTPRWRRRC